MSLDGIEGLWPNAILTTDKKLTAKQYNKLRKKWCDIFKGRMAMRVPNITIAGIPPIPKSHIEPSKPWPRCDGKQCTHEHVSRGVCLYCGEEGVE